MGGISFAPVLGTGGRYIADSEGNVYGPKGLRKPQPVYGQTSRRRTQRHQKVMYRGRDGKALAITCHRAVYTAFYGPVPAGVDLRHLDGDPTNNRLDNLTTGTRAENVEDARRHGTLRVGERHPSAKLSDDQVSEIRRRYAEGGVLQRELALEYRVNRRCVGRIIDGTRRKDSL